MHVDDVTPDVRAQIISDYMRSVRVSGAKARHAGMSARERREHSRRIATAQHNRTLDAIWRTSGSIRGEPREYMDRVWARRIPKIYERLYSAARAGESIPPFCFDVLKAMTLMCPSLSPASVRAAALPSPEGIALPSSVDLSHVSDDDLARIVGRSSQATQPPASVPRETHINDTRAKSTNHAAAADDSSVAKHGGVLTNRRSKSGSSKFPSIEKEFGTIREAEALLAEYLPVPIGESLAKQGRHAALAAKKRRGRPAKPASL